MPPRTPQPAGSLEDALRTFDERQLTALLTERPDLCAAAPRDLAGLALGASQTASVRHALDGLTRPQRAVAEAVAANPGHTARQLSALLGYPAGTAVARLKDLALVSGAPELYPVLGLRTAFGPYPGGLAEPSEQPLGPHAIATALAGLPEAAVAVLHQLAWGPPTGAVRNADRRLTEPASPVDHLLARGLLRALDAHTVVLPREVALQLRGGFLREPLTEPARLPPGRRPAPVIDSAAVGAAYEFVTDSEGLLDALAARAPRPLRTGGMAARDLSALARAIRGTADRSGFLLEVAYAAGLIVTGPVISPTEAYDRWLNLPLEARHAHLLRAWYAESRWPAAGRRDGGRPLGPAGDAPWAPHARRAVLEALTPADEVDPKLLALHAAWRRPALARHGDVSELTGEVVTEAAWLGITALGQASALVSGLSGGLSAVTPARFPELVDRLILQNDLTAVATGPLDRRTATPLALLADIESRGGGGVFRFSAASLQRAFDAGWDRDAICDWLAAHSTTGVPQPLHYLVGDVARLHGTVRVGAARAYVRIDDPARLATVLARPEAAGLGLRRVGPETLVADSDPADVVGLLRAAGLSPVAENADGEVLSAQAPRRPAAPRAPIPRADPAGVAAALTARQVAHDRIVSTDEILAGLTRAALEARLVQIDYAAADGTPARASGVVRDVADGVVRLSGDSPIVLPLARITAVSGLA